MLINLLGFQQLVDAIGGVTVNINEPIAINGNTDAGIPPTGYLEPGPDQHLDGFHALWYSRGRWGSDDYQRMLRQRCMVNAIVDEADPLNVLRRYQALAQAGKEILRTDIPRELMPCVRRPGPQGQGEEDEVDRLRDVRQVLLRRPRLPLDAVGRGQGARPRTTAPARRTTPGTAVTADDACGYHPVELTPAQLRGLGSGHPQRPVRVARSTVGLPR